MSDENKGSKVGLALRGEPILYFSLLLALGMVLCFWIARSPTSYTGKLPFIGENFPVKLNAIYFIVLGPLVGMLSSAALWFEATRVDFSSLPLKERSKKRGLSGVLGFLFFVIFVSSSLLSLQYFVILAPADLCPSRPHFEFLWQNLKGLEKINHCMSGTKEINAEAPYYLEPQVIQAWGHVIAPLLTLLFLSMTWKTLRRKTI
ncbi:hypothetical protein [Methylorubrum sp. SB2]|uniref:hypothetical protein n=1 Tax=Methylorubrum subtropicum TaxID=3138812 RepID=UPI00313AFD00